MDRREVLKRELRANAYWGIGARDDTCRGIGQVGCQGIDVEPSAPPVVRPGEPFYTVSLDTTTGEVTVQNFDGQGNEIVND